jgi:hypothetical protein
MTRAGVGGGRGREKREGGEGGEVEEGVGGELMAERRTSKGEEERGDPTTLRPSMSIVWSLCLSWQG